MAVFHLLQLGWRLQKTLEVPFSRWSASLLKHDASSAWEVAVQVRGSKVSEQRYHRKPRCSSVYERGILHSQPARHRGKQPVPLGLHELEVSCHHPDVHLQE